MYREISSRRFSLCHSDRKMNAGRLFPEPKGRCGSRACAPTCTNTFNGPRLGNLLSDVPSTFVAHAGMADVAYTDVFEPAFNSCCDACSCSDAVRQQGWQTLQELRRQKDIFTDGQVWLVWHSRCVIINAFPHLLRALTRAIYPQKTGSLCTPPQQADDFVNGQACAVLYLTGLGAGSLVSVSKIVHHMKLNMKVSSSPGAEGRRGAGMANSRLLRCCAGLLFPCGGSAVAAEARAASGGTQTGEGAVRHLHRLLQEVA